MRVRQINTDLFIHIFTIENIILSYKKSARIRLIRENPRSIILSYTILHKKVNYGQVHYSRRQTS